MAIVAHITPDNASGSSLPAPDPDADLIPRLAAGDEAALSDLMDRHLSQIQSLAVRMLGDPASAEDVAQTVFIKTWEHAATWEPGKAKLLTWMRRVATNQCLDMLKKHKPIYTDCVPDQEDNRASPQDDLHAKEQSERVKTAVMKLPDRQRAALTLAYYQHVSQKDGAAILKISQSAYESLLVRARKALRKALLEADGQMENFS